MDREGRSPEPRCWRNELPPPNGAEDQDVQDFLRRCFHKTDVRGGA